MGKQVKVRGEKSDWYEVAVFQLKEGVDEGDIPYNLVDYAENIIEKNLKLKKVIKGYEAATTNPAKKKVKAMEWIDFLFWGSIGMFLILSFCYILI